MSKRRYEVPKPGGFGRKLLTWLVIGAVIYWAGREPAHAAAVFHAIVTGLGEFFRQVGQHAARGKS